MRTGTRSGRRGLGVSATIAVMVTVKAKATVVAAAAAAAAEDLREGAGEIKGARGAASASKLTVYFASPCTTRWSTYLRLDDCIAAATAGLSFARALLSSLWQRC
jgi:hypothetical protein